MKVRVYAVPDGPVMILVPNEKQREEGESDDALLARTASDAEEGDPTLVGLEYADVESDSIPADRKDRDRLILKDGAVIIGPPTEDEVVAIDRAAEVNIFKDRAQKVVDDKSFSPALRDAFGQLIKLVQ